MDKVTGTLDVRIGKSNIVATTTMLDVFWIVKLLYLLQLDQLVLNQVAQRVKDDIQGVELNITLERYDTS